MDRWREYEDGKLTPPCVVQHDEVGKEHLIWVWDGTAIIGPMSRAAYDEKAVIADAAELAKPIEQPPTEVEVLRAEIDTLKVEIAVKAAEITAKDADIKKKDEEIAALKAASEETKP